MKKNIYYSVILLAALFYTVINPPSARCQTDTGLFNFQVILPGMTKSVDIRQAGAFPLGCPLFFIAVAGKGTLGISLKKDDVAGDIIFMLGAAVSAAGTVPVYRIGQSKGMIDQIMEIGTDEQPGGFVWLWCGVAFSQLPPKYLYQVRLSVAP